MIYQAAAVPTLSVLIVLAMFLFLQLLLGNSVYSSSSPEPSEALYLRDGASQQNTLYSNILINESGQEISLDSN